MVEFTELEFNTAMAKLTSTRVVESINKDKLLCPMETVGQQWQTPAEIYDPYNDYNQLLPIFWENGGEALMQFSARDTNETLFRVRYGSNYWTRKDPKVAIRDYLWEVAKVGLDMIDDIG